MFDVLRKKLVALSGTRICSFEDLPHLELDSIDSICLSDTTSASDEPPVMLDGSGMQHFCKRKVLANLRSIKRLEQLHPGDGRISMLAFFDMLHDQQYPHVSMSLLGRFMKACRMAPRPFFLHYYMFFLCYAAYYHHYRGFVDVVSPTHVPMHRYHLSCIRQQLKYLQYSIDRSRSHG